MILAEGSVTEYHELLKLSIEDYLIRFKMFIDDIKARNERVKETNRKNGSK